MAATKKATKKKPAKKRSPRQPKNPSTMPLPEAVDVPVQGSELQPERESMFDLPSLFRSESSQPNHNHSADAFSTGGTGETLSDEAQRILDSVPDHIGGEQPGSATAEQPGDDLAALLPDEVFGEEQVRGALAWIGGKLADWRKHEEYRAAGENAAVAAKSWAQVANLFWQKYAPGFFRSMCNEIPGLEKALVLTALAFAPAVMTDVATAAERRAQQRVPRVQEPPKRTERAPRTASDAAPRGSQSAVQWGN